MLIKEIHDAFSLMKSNCILRTSALSVLFVSSLMAVFFSSVTALFIFVSYIFGFIICWSLIKYQTKASFCLQRLVSFYRGHISPRKNLGSLCGVCNKISCKRHLFNQSATPWKSLYIDKRLNDAVEQFYNRIIEDFVTSWYKHFTDDVTFLNELRYCLRFATTSLINKILQLDVGNIIVNKLIPCAVKHVDDYLYMEQIAKLRNVSVNDVAVEYLGKRLHVATTNRKNELSYLRHLTSGLMYRILPKDNVNCRNFFVLIREIIAGWVLLPMMDVLADPNIINSLLILITTYKSKGGSHTNQLIHKVQLMCNFKNGEVKPSSFSTDLKSIKRNTDLLYVFVQFLKREHSVHLLQFCLDVDEFNNKLLTPDLSKRQLEELHKDALNLYNSYLNVDGSNFIGCSQEICHSYHQLLQGGVYNVARLRTSEPLYQAYEYALNVLENNWLPSFFHSNEFYSYICGPKVTAVYTKPLAAAKNRKYYESNSQGTVAKISSGLVRIRVALKTNQPIDGALYPPESQSFENGAVEDIIITECGNIFRDLSTWRVSITSVDTLQHNSKALILYNIHVQRLDSDCEEDRREWTLQRRDQDFYTLKAKLIEFHGENEICDSPLPSRRISTGIEARRARYEEFLRKLLQKPALKGSDLLHTFLTTEKDFTLLVSSAVPVGDLGNIYQSVAYKLRKEKGQHLDSFMNTFLSSTGKSKQGKFEWAEIGDELDMSAIAENQIIALPKTYTNSVFNDNFGVPLKTCRHGSSCSFNPSGITESLFYLLKQIFKVPLWVLKLFVAVCCVGQQAVESACRLFIERKLKAALSQTNLAYLMGLLEGVVFQSHVPPTEEELAERKARAFTELNNSVPFYIPKIFGPGIGVGLAKLLEILQNPLLNKQLAYNLLDLIIVEIYPEFDEEDLIKEQSI